MKDTSPSRVTPLAGARSEQRQCRRAGHCGRHGVFEGLAGSGAAPAGHPSALTSSQPTGRSRWWVAARYRHCPIRSVRKAPRPSLGVFLCTYRNRTLLCRCVSAAAGAACNPHGVPWLHSGYSSRGIHGLGPPWYGTRVMHSGKKANRRFLECHLPLETASSDKCENGAAIGLALSPDNTQPALAHASRAADLLLE